MEEEKYTKFEIKKSIGFILSIGILCLFLGLIFSIYTKQYYGNENSGLTGARKLTGIVQLLKETETQNSILEKQLNKLKHQLEKNSEGTMPASISSPQFKKIYEAAGLTALKNSGILISLDDSENANNPNIGNYNLISSDDLLKIINELKAAGAIAIAINEQRLVTTSEIVTAGNAIVVNQTKLSPPYLIKAIGPADMMISSLKMRGGLIEYLGAFGINLRIFKSKKVRIPAYTKAF